MIHRLLVRFGNSLFHYRNALFPLGYLLLFLPSSRLFGDDRIAALVGFSVAMAGQLIRVVTVGLEYIIRGGKNRQIYAKKLVTGGIFAHCRNPLYLGNVMILAGLGLAADSVLFLVFGLGLFVFAYVAIVAAEEEFLRQKFGAEFDAYCKRVNRFIPRVSGLRATLAGMRFNWRRVITAEYGSAFLWLEAFLFATMQNLHDSGRITFRDPLSWSLCGLAMLVFVAFVAARILKKSGALGEMRARTTEAEALATAGNAKGAAAGDNEILPLENVAR